LKIESLQNTYSIQNWSLAVMWIEEVFSRPSIFNLQSTSTSLQRFPWVGTSDSTDMKKMSTFGLFPKTWKRQRKHCKFYILHKTIRHASFSCRNNSNWKEQALQTNTFIQRVHKECLKQTEYSFSIGSIPLQKSLFLKISFFISIR
jgi:hypothetical protein